MSAVPSFLRVFDPALSPRHESPARTRTTRSIDGKLSPRSTFSQFWDRWLLPIWFRTRGQGEGTIRGYREAKDWWVKLTGDPPLDQIDAHLLLDFGEELEEVRFHRDYRSDRQAEPLRAQMREVSLQTRLNVRSRLNTMFRRLGHGGDADDPHACILDVPPLFGLRKDYKLLRADHEGPKPAFSIATIRRLLQAADQMTTPQIPGIAPGDWWRGYDGCMVYLGLRMSEAGALRYSMLKPTSKGRYIFDLPAAITKAKRRERLPVHPRLAEVLLRIRTDRDLIFPWPHCARHLQTCHDRLQQLAEVPADQQMGFHAFRRTFAVLLDRLGARAGAQAAKEGCRHVDVETTKQHYSANTARLLRKFPNFFASPAPVAAAEDAQPLLFDVD